MAGRDVVVGFVVKSEGALVSQELMLGLHSTKSEDAGELKLAHCVATILAQFLSLELDPHGCHVFGSLFDDSLDLSYFLLREDRHQCRGLDYALEDSQTTAEITLGRKVDTLSHFLVERGQ